MYRWVQRFAVEFIEAARPCGRRPGDRWFVDGQLPAALHVIDRYANNRLKLTTADSKAVFGPCAALKRLSSARTLTAGHAFVQNLRRGHCELATDKPVQARVRIAFEQLVQAV